MGSRDGVWSWQASERISVIAEQAKWSHETWQSEIAPAITANEVWGSSIDGSLEASSGMLGALLVVFHRRNGDRSALVER